MGYLCLRQHICHLSLCVLATFLFIPAAAEKLASEPGNEHNTVPPLWHLAPGNFEDFPIQDDKIVINAWNYRERMGMYKILLNYSAKYFATLGPKNTGNVLWGLPLQHGWQYLTGRLADPRNVTTCGHHDGDKLCISVQSWWACMNYYLSIIPFLGALESGLFGELPYEIEVLSPDEARADFCHSIAECNTQAPEVMSSWKDFFKYLLSTSANSGNHMTLSFSKDEALHYMWKAHVLSIAQAHLRFQKRIKYFSGPESRFGESWRTAVDFIGATRFSTDQGNTNHFQTGLPPRMLWEGDIAPFIGDLTAVQNKVVVLLSVLHKTNDMMGGTLLLLWRSAMSTEAGREAGRKLIESAVNVK